MARTSAEHQRQRRKGEKVLKMLPQYSIAAEPFVKHVTAARQMVRAKGIAPPAVIRVSHRKGVEAFVWRESGMWGYACIRENPLAFPDIAQYGGLTQEEMSEAHIYLEESASITPPTRGWGLEQPGTD